MNLKRRLIRILPEPLRRRILANHYLRLYRRMRPESVPDLQAVRPFIAEGDLVVDIGANVGIYTRFFSRWVGPTGRVISVEPGPTAFSYLHHNLVQAAAKNVDARRVALSDRPGTLELELPRTREGWDDIYLAHVADHSQATRGPRFEVEATTLDRILANEHARLTFVKCDVEGHELSVLQGAERITDRDRPVWLLEVNQSLDAPDTAAGQVLEWFTKRGYACMVPDGPGWRPRAPLEQRVNYLFVPSRAKEGETRRD